MIFDLRCVSCGQSHDLMPGRSHCDCGERLTVRYELAEVTLDRGGEGPPGDIWRWAPMLPVRDPDHIRSMGEGGTPLIRARRLGEWAGGVDLWIKDESRNPTGSWEARGYACAVSCAIEAARGEVTAAGSEQAAAACAAYAAAAGLTARVRVDPAWPAAFRVACLGAGACEAPAPSSWDPFRIEGLKTAAYEMAEQLDWEAPRMILCATKDGAFALGKGWEEMAALGWVGPGTPAVACATAGGLGEWIDAGLEMARLTGVLPAPETAGCLVGLKGLLSSGTLTSGDKVVVVNTASGMLYSEVYARRFRGGAVGEADKLGGLITPR